MSLKWSWLKVVYKMSFFSKSTETWNVTSMNIGRSFQRVHGHSHRHTFGFLGSHLGCGLRVCVLLLLSSASNHTDIQHATWRLDWNPVIPSFANYFRRLSGLTHLLSFFPFNYLSTANLSSKNQFPSHSDLDILFKPWDIAFRVFCFVVFCPAPHLHLFPGYFRKTSSHITVGLFSSLLTIK